MLPEARVAAKGDDPEAETWRRLAQALTEAAEAMAGRP
jgi:hypothetical protein